MVQNAAEFSWSACREGSNTDASFGVARLATLISDEGVRQRRAEKVDVGRENDYLGLVNVTLPALSFLY